MILIGAAALAWVAALLIFPRSSAPPEAEFVLLDGRKISMQTLHGRPVLVSFWATTCAP